MSFVDQILALLRWKRFILGNTALVAVLSVVVALLLPKTYSATASVFPPEEEGLSLGNLSSLLSAGALAGGRTSLPLLATPSDLFAAVLKSRTLREEMVRRFDLMTVYKVKEMDDAVEALSGNLSVKVGGEGVVSVRALDRSPELAAQMANGAVELLDRLNREKRSGSAHYARIFIEQRLAQNRVDLAAAEDTLRIVQERGQVFVPEDQARAVISAAAEAQAQLIVKEVELGVLSGQVGREHPERIAMEREVATWRRRLAELESGAGGPRGSRFEIPLHDYPERALAYVRALREVEVQQAIYQLLVQQYEQFRIQETRDTPTVQVLDRAVTPTKRYRPIRWIICVSATLTAFFVSVILAAVLERVARLRRDDPERFARLRELLRQLKLEPLVDRL